MCWIIPTEETRQEVATEAVDRSVDRDSSGSGLDAVELMCLVRAAAAVDRSTELVGSGLDAVQPTSLAETVVVDR